MESFAGWKNGRVLSKIIKHTYANTHTNTHTNNYFKKKERKKKAFHQNYLNEKKKAFHQNYLNEKTKQNKHSIKIILMEEKKKIPPTSESLTRKKN